jgi:large subunit ribosomal protein L19e
MLRMHACADATCYRSPFIVSQHHRERPLRTQALRHRQSALRVQVKGNCFKNKRVLMEAVHDMKSEKAIEKNLAEQLEARRAKNKATRERKIARREERLVGGGATGAPAEQKKSGST